MTYVSKTKGRRHLAGSSRRARGALTVALRHARREAGLTGFALAQLLGAGWAQPKVSKIESGRQFPSGDEVLAWAEATGASAHELNALHQRALHEYNAFRAAYADAGGADQAQAAYEAADRSASALSAFHPTLIHGLLQTADYARALFRLPGGPADHGADTDEIDRMVAARMRRSAILYEPDREITVLVSEAALLNRVGSADVMREQLQQIVRLATATHATIGIVPFQKFPVLVQHGWDRRDQIVTVETTAGDLEIADPAEVAQYERWSQLLREAAVTGADVARMCKRHSR